MKTITVPALARVEGEGGLYIGLKDGKAAEIRLDIYEPPRFFEGFLIDRFLQEVPDITARICGICPVAYQMSSAQALEAALGVKVSPEVKSLRRLMYCGEYIESHALHIFMLQAPDLFGKESAFELATVAPEIVANALRMKKIGNRILSIIGGRSIHPVNVCVGGFYSWPDATPLTALLPELEWGLKTSIEYSQWAAGLPYPELESDYECVALHDDKEYGVLNGEIRSSKRGSVPLGTFETEYLETHIKHSNALHSYTKDKSTYLVGPVARLNLNHEQLSETAKQALVHVDMQLPLKNPYKSLLARAIELVQFFDEAIALVKTYRPEGPAHVELNLREGEGAAATEAPRGLLYHRYKVDKQGLVRFAKITPPTAQNLARIEADLLALSPRLIKLPTPEATRAAEDLVRSYDPCISCATHFLKLKVEEVE